MSLCISLASARIGRVIHVKGNNTTQAERKKRVETRDAAAQTPREDLPSFWECSAEELKDFTKEFGLAAEAQTPKK